MVEDIRWGPADLKIVSRTDCRSADLPSSVPPSGLTENDPSGRIFLEPIGDDICVVDEYQFSDVQS